MALEQTSAFGSLVLTLRYDNGRTVQITNVVSEAEWHAMSAHAFADQIAWPMAAWMKAKEDAHEKAEFTQAQAALAPAPDQVGDARNTGHGHVFPRPDGARMRCGGPGLCGPCSNDVIRAEALTSAERREQGIVVGRWR